MEDVKSYYHTKGISYKGDEKDFMDFLTLIDEGQHQEDPISNLKPKGNREVNNLDCSINFDTRGVCSSRSKGKRVVAIL
jgi:hypothetical protein